jgi:rhodanese-related sulfurtransferase
MRLSNLRYFLPAFIILIFVVSPAYGAEEFIRINKDQLKQELQSPDVIVIDVRTAHDWDSSQWKIPGARREPPDATKEWMDKYPKGKTIVLYCA